MNNEFIKNALSKFSGCDNEADQAGTSDRPSTWLFGIEWGTYQAPSEEDADTAPDDSPLKRYAIELQMKDYPFNRKACQLLAAIEGKYDPQQYWEFGIENRPFERGIQGRYFKGNLYPYPCHSVHVWDADAQRHTGAATKAEYRDWCRKERFPAIRAWVNEHRPDLFIGVGVSCRNDFAAAVFDNKVELQQWNFEVNGHAKSLYHYAAEGRILVVVPHFSGPYGLNSHESMRKAGRFIAQLRTSATLS